jgi:O-succinylbenzoate synthase
LQLTAQSKDLTLVDLLNPNAKQIVSVNALLTGKQTEIVERAAQCYEDGYRAFKIKIGRGNLHDEISTIHKVRKIVGDESLIRLDANRAFDIATALDFYEQLKSVNIDYIEEPFKSFELVEQYFNDHHNKMPIALDESLAEIQPEMLNNLFALKAIVLKPTLLGYTNSMMFAKKAFALGIQPVISSSFETSIGTFILASMGAIIDSKIPIGVGTLSWFEDDLVYSPLSIKNGKIDLSKPVDINSQIDFSKLTEVALDNK